MAPLTPQDVQAALLAAGLDIQVQTLTDSTATAPLAAAALGTELGSIVKSILFMAEDKPVLVLTAGDQRVHDGKVAKLVEVRRKLVNLANGDQCLEHTGYAPGGVPPVGHRSKDITIFIDQTLSRFETIYGAAGTANTLFPILYQDLVRITGGTVADVVKDPKPQA